MGFEDRDYYRSGDFGDSPPGIPGFRFNRQSVVTSLIVVNVVLFVADMFTPALTLYDLLPEPPADGAMPVVNTNLGPRPADQIPTGDHWLSYLLALKADQPWAVWNLLTHGFAHASFTSELGIFHILGNMLTLFFLGPPIEQRLGRGEFLRFYLLAILVGGATWLLVQLATGSHGYCVGASGAVSAVVIYFIFLAPDVRLLLFGIIPMKAWMVGVLFLIMNLSYAFGNSQIAWEAHLAGGAFGAIYFAAGLNFSKWRWPAMRSTRLKIHRAEVVDDRLQAEADRILAKISLEGEGSLTSKERRTLQKYSKLIRNQRNSR